MKKKIGLLICLCILLFGSLFYVYANENTGALTNYATNTLNEYEDENSGENTIRSSTHYSIIDYSSHDFNNPNGGHISNGIWRLSNNYLAFCAQGLLASPGIGDSISAPYQVNNESLIKALYYSYGGPGDIITSRYGESGAIVLTDELVSNAYSGTCISKTDTGFHWNNVVGSLWNEIMSKPLPSDYYAYMVNVDGTGENWLGNITNKQKLVYGVYEPKGSLKLKKSSTLPNISDGNALYSLKNTKYGIFLDEECVRLVDTFILNENGESNTVDNLVAQTYYVKEMEVSKGFVKDETAYKVDVKKNTCQTIEVQDIPKSNILNLVLKKNDSETGEVAQGHGTLEGAEFLFKYYDGYYDEITNDMKPLRQWIMKTDSEGLIYFDADHKVSGDDFYKDKDGKIVFPLGTVTAQESKPCSGYQLNKTLFLQKLTTSLNTEHFSAYRMFNVKNDIIRIKITKVQTGTTTPLTGVIFNHTSPSGVVKKMRTNTNGQFTFVGAETGIHKLQELKTLSGYVLSDKIYEFEVKQDGSVDIKDDVLTIENDVQPYTLKIIKKNSSDSLLDGAKFGLYSDSECKTLIEEKISVNGIVEFNNLENLKHYYFKEIQAPKGYELDSTIHEVYTDLIPFTKQYDVYIDQVKYTDKITDFIITYDCVNKKTAKLPNTGSSITLIMFIVGFICMIFRRRMNEK